jgi:hypothetical protein
VRIVNFIDAFYVIIEEVDENAIEQMQIPKTPLLLPAIAGNWLGDKRKCTVMSMM